MRDTPFTRLMFGHGSAPAAAQPRPRSSAPAPQPAPAARSPAALQPPPAPRRPEPDVNVRREDLHRLAQARGKNTTHTQSRDHIGPFTVEHSDSGSTVRLGELKPRHLPHPSAELLLETMEQEQVRLRRAAEAAFSEEALARMEQHQAHEPDRAIPLPELLKAAGRPIPKETVVYGVALLRSQGLRGRQAQISPPTLAEQGSAITVPSLDRANDPERIFRLRLVKAR